MAENDSRLRSSITRRQFLERCALMGLAVGAGPFVLPRAGEAAEVVAVRRVMTPRPSGDDREDVNRAMAELWGVDSNG